MTEDQILSFADTFMRAIQSGDAAKVRSCYAADAKIWHNTDGVEQSVDDNLKVLGWFMRKIPDRYYRVVRREALKNGFIQQHVLEVTLPSGTRWTMSACVVVSMEDGLITRLDEYLDSAQANVLRELGR